MSKITIIGSHEQFHWALVLRDAIFATDGYIKGTVEAQQSYGAKIGSLISMSVYDIKKTPNEPDWLNPEFKHDGIIRPLEFSAKRSIYDLTISIMPENH